MKTNKLIAQLRREAKAHPKQVTVLGGLAAVGLYFWAPLLSAWWEEAPDKKTKLAAKPATAATATAAKNKGDAPPAARPALAWRSVWQKISTDKRMKPAGELARSRNPFQTEPPPPPKPAEVAGNASDGAKTDGSKPAATTTVRVQEGPTPQSLGMKLNAIMIGPAGRSAIIGDTLVGEGDYYVYTPGEKNAAGTSKVVTNLQTIQDRRAHALRDFQTQTYNSEVDDWLRQVRESVSGLSGPQQSKILQEKSLEALRNAKQQAESGNRELAEKLFNSAEELARKAVAMDFRRQFLMRHFSRERDAFDSQKEKKEAMQAAVAAIFNDSDNAMFGEIERRYGRETGANGDESENQIIFQLVHVGAQSAILARAGETHVLELQKPQLPERDELKVVFTGGTKD